LRAPSRGYAIFPEDGASTEAVLQAADRALFSSSKPGATPVAVGEAISSETLRWAGDLEYCQ